MSAFIVDKEDIDVIVTACIERGIGKALGMTANEIGRMLWLENLASVKYRYPNDKDGEWPGPIGLKRKHIASYRWEDRQPSPEHHWNGARLSGYLSCYTYQSCEHPGWGDSAACEIVNLLGGVAV